MDSSPKLQITALEAISCVVSNKECVLDIANAEVMAYLLPLMHSLQSGKLPGHLCDPYPVAQLVL